MSIFEDADFWFEILWAVRCNISPYTPHNLMDAAPMPPIEFIGDGGETIQLHVSYNKDFKQRCDDTYVREVRYRVGNIFVFDVDFIIDRDGKMDDYKFWNTELIPNNGMTEEDCEHVMMCFMLQADKLLPERKK